MEFIKKNWHITVAMIASSQASAIFLGAWFRDRETTAGILAMVAIVLLLTGFYILTRNWLNDSGLLRKRHSERDKNYILQCPHCTMGLEFRLSDKEHSIITSGLTDEHLRRSMKRKVFECDFCTEPVLVLHEISPTGVLKLGLADANSPHDPVELQYPESR